VVAVRGGLPGEVDLVLERIEVIVKDQMREYVPKISSAVQVCDRAW